MSLEFRSEEGHDGTPDTHCPEPVSLPDDAFPVHTRLPPLHHQVVEKQDSLLLPLRHRKEDRKVCVCVCES